MSSCTEERLPRLSVFLYEEASEYGQAVCRVFIGYIATLYRNCLRHTFVRPACHFHH